MKALIIIAPVSTRMCAARADHSIEWRYSINGVISPKSMNPIRKTNQFFVLNMRETAIVSLGEVWFILLNI